MADNPATMTNIVNALKYFYLDGLRYQLNEGASPFLSQLEKTSEGVVGSKIIMALSYGVTGGIGNRADNGTLPTVNPRKFVQAEWETKNMFARIQVTDKAIEASKSSRGGFVQILTHDMEAAERDAKRDVSRQVMGDGTGLLATVTNVSSDGTTHTVTVDSAKWFAEGMLIDCYTSTTKDTSEAEITLVDKDNSQIKFVATTAPEAGDLIYLAGNKGLELTGVGAVMTADSTIYGLDRNTYKFFNPTVKAVNGEISEVKIQEGIDEAEDECGNTIDLLLCGKAVRRSCFNLLTAQKVQIQPLDLKGGFKAISFSGLPLTADKYVPKQTLFALSQKNWKLYEMDDWNWIDRDGAILSRASTKPIWEATLRKYADLGCDLPRGQVKFTGITEH
jgi:hypothetical protein